MKEILKLALSLTLICAIAGAALAFVSHKTEKPREESKIHQRNEKMALLLPAETAQTDEMTRLQAEDGTQVTYFIARGADGEVLAYCAESSDPSGFGGELKVLVGLEKDGTVRGVLVSENSETPGIGSHVCNRDEAKSFWSLFRRSGCTAKQCTENAGRTLPPNSYLDSYNGQTLPENGFAFHDGKAAGFVTPISGATVSSTAVLNAVNRVCKTWKSAVSTTAATPASN